MKVTFVYPNINNAPNYKDYIYLGIGYLSAVLKRAGHQVSLIQVTKPIPDAEFISYILAQQPHIVAFSVTTNMFLPVRNWARLIKKTCPALIICGGPHPTIDPEGTIKVEGIDMVCVGEGEESLVELCARLEQKSDISNIPNIWLKENGRISKNEPRPLIEELDSLPFPDRDIFDYKNTDETCAGIYRLLASRGCPYNCSYCCNHSIREVYTGKGKYVRFRRPINVISELEYALKRYSRIKYFHFIDDILTADKHWFQNFARLYKQKIGTPYICHIHPNLIDQTLVKLLKESNCFQVQIGIESGNDYIRNNILNRNITRQQIINGFDLCKRDGLRTYAYNMVGLPFEGKLQILDTIKLNAQIEPHLTHTSIFYPYPRTKLYNFCKTNNLLTQKETDNYFSETILAFDPKTENFIIFSQRFFDFIVKCYSKLYKLPKTFCNLGLKCLDSLFLWHPFVKGVNLLRHLYIRLRKMTNRKWQQ